MGARGGNAKHKPDLSPNKNGAVKTSRVVLLVSVLGLLTAALAFGEKAIDFTRKLFAPDQDTAARVAPTSSLPPRRSAPPETSASPAAAHHVVIHEAGTEHVLTSQDNLIITDEMMNKPARNETPAADLADDFYNFCTNYKYRILNATDRTITVWFGVAETDNIETVGIGPGERWVSEDLPNDHYVVTDDKNRWVMAFSVDTCSS